METVWRTLRGKLSVTSGDEFERLALHYLRILWPHMIRSPRLQHLDNLGVDLSVPGETDGYFEVVVQVKGFKADEQLLKSQVKNLIIPSIQKFRASQLKCSLYILLHNRDGSNRALASEIQTHLDELKTAGIAKEVLLLDRDNFVIKLRDQIHLLLKERLKARSLSLLKQQESFFHFGNLFIEQVPLSTHKWKPNTSIKHSFNNANFLDTDVAKLISSPQEVRYAILIGTFGIGKTTLALRSAATKDHAVIYVRAHTISPHYRGGQGTTTFFRNLNNELDLLEGFPADTAEILNELVGTALARILRQVKSEFVLILDGIDENNSYSTPYGLQLLTNELADLRCPIVITTRKEHFLALMGNYEIALENRSKKGSAKRSVDILNLGPWTTRQANQLLNSVLNTKLTIKQKNKMNELINSLNTDTHNTFSEVLSHPLFLQMTLDLIMGGEYHIVKDTHTLIEAWMKKKIQRDLKSPRFEPYKSIDVDAYVANMISAMSALAKIMVTEENGIKVLTDSIDSQKVVDVVQRFIPIPTLDIATILNTSLLIPVNRRQGNVLSVKFFHRAIQEYLLQRKQSD